MALVQIIIKQRRSTLPRTEERNGIDQHRLISQSFVVVGLSALQDGMVASCAVMRVLLSSSAEQSTTELLAFIQHRSRSGGVSFLFVQHTRTKLILLLLGGGRSGGWLVVVRKREESGSFRFVSEDCNLNEAVLHISSIYLWSFLINKKKDSNF